MFSYLLEMLFLRVLNLPVEVVSGFFILFVSLYLSRKSSGDSRGNVGMDGGMVKVRRTTRRVNTAASTPRRQESLKGVVEMLV